MNIFYLDKEPSLAAEYLHDTHVNKMLLETCQILSTTHHYFGDKFENWSKHVKYRAEPYKSTHINHPCCAWARANYFNYNWLVIYADCLAKEFKFRKSKEHKCGGVAEYFAKNRLNDDLPFMVSTKVFMTRIPLCMPEEFHIPNDPVGSYRNYYNKVKFQDKNDKRMDTWTKREKPFWWVDISERCDII